jgi:hypothetical protein
MAKNATAKAVEAARTATAQPDPATLPQTVTLASPYGFYDEDGAGNWWSAGYVVTDPDEILILIERDAPLLPWAAPVAEQPST